MTFLTAGSVFRNFSKFFFYLIALFIASSSFSYADNIPVIVITPSKSIQSYNNVGSSVSIIDSEIINDSSEYFLGDVLDKSFPLQIFPY
jgi:outer membrane cobalamin receptor